MKAMNNPLNSSCAETEADFFVSADSGNLIN